MPLSGIFHFSLASVCGFLDAEILIKPNPSRHSEYLNKNFSLTWYSKQPLHLPNKPVSSRKPLTDQFQLFLVAVRLNEQRKVDFSVDITLTVVELLTLSGKRDSAGYYQAATCYCVSWKYFREKALLCAKNSSAESKISPTRDFRFIFKSLRVVKFA